MVNSYRKDRYRAHAILLILENHVNIRIELIPKVYKYEYIKRIERYILKFSCKIVCLHNIRYVILTN